MLIFEYNELQIEQIEDIRELVSVCNRYEGLSRNPILQNENLYEDMNCYYLCYEKNKLISVLIIDQLISSEAEIIGYTLPAFRRQGYFNKLLEKAMNELAYFNIFKILMIVEPSSIIGSSAAKELGEYVYSEYMLQHDLSNRNKECLNNQISYKELNNIQILEQYISTYTNDIDALSIEAAKSAIQTDHMICLVALKDQEVVGICNVSLECNIAYLFGLYIFSKYRRQGFGLSFVHHIMEISNKTKKTALALQVGNNVPALNLYLKIGFKIVEQLDYYTIYTEVDEDF